ncbi:MAG: aminotransferase class V-fold PLP-dependent enzyme [Acidobacteriaceae bacterium]|nr:aminotransferase class V-fold PLP-dependent enzyme [Acidobacteriota bacterium]MBV9498006.1 aminotransferase class V-fold PLP-dependent enzyme [Acidobacteriaceae bacterium]
MGVLVQTRAACEEEHFEIAALHEVQRAAAEIEGLIENGPIVPTVTPEEIRGYLRSRYDFATPVPLDAVMGDVQQMLRKWQVHVTHPRYFGLFNPSVTVASVVADLLAAMYNPQLATWRTSPAANEIERHTLAWLAGKFGLPDETVSNFTSGGQESNLSAVVVALAHAFPELGECGLHGLAKSPVIYVTGGAHHGFVKIARMTGLGRAALRTVSMGEDLKMELADLAKKVAEDRNSGLAPLMVIATAGSTAAGVIDPLPDLARFCREENLWFHVDAAWGGAAVISPGLRGHLAGISEADSITCDAHKWFSVPMGAGMFFCRHPNAVLSAFESEVAFMPGKTSSVLDPYTSTTQWSRRFIGLKLFLALAERGEAGYAQLIEQQTRMGDVLRRSLERSGWRIVNRTPLPLVCFTRNGLVASKFLSELYKRQIAWMSEVQLGSGEPVLRACVTSIRTTETDIEWVVREMSRIPGGES